MRRLTPVWIFIFIFVAGIIYLPGLSKYMNLRRKESQLTNEIKRLQTEIDSLKQEEQLMKTSVVRLEEVVRQELGLVKPGEVIYRVVEEDRQDKENTPEKTSEVGKEKEKSRQ